ncbi:hypothetical protein [Negadavirga shengliensis]|uniref:DUF748 domain-containing protein n=1 Tax=Negadavirga shengliensis TaxID=1389218 RepID=A0ABV9T0N6_9BACT
MRVKRPLILLLVFASAIFILFQVIPMIINWYLNQNAAKIVRDMITRGYDFAGHEVRFGKIRFDYDYRGTYLQLNDVEIIPGETLQEKDKIRFHLNFEAASLTGFKWIDFLLNNSIKLDSAYIENVSLESITPPLEALDLDNSDKKRGEGEDYNKISMNHIRVNRVSFDNKDSYTDSTRLSIKDLFLFADDFELTKEDINDPEALFSVDNVEGYMDQAVLHFNQYRNALLAKDLSFNTEDQKMIIEKVTLNNKLGKYEYTGQFEKETDWMELHQGKVQLGGMDFQTFFRKGHIVAESLTLEDPELEIFRDKRKPEDRERRPKMIHEVVKELPKKVRVDNVIIENAYVSYEERPDNDAPRAGKIFFDQINATIGKVTNFSEDLEKDDRMEVKARGRLIGRAKIDLKVTYFINDEKGKFLMNGKIGSMMLNPLNEMIEPATQVAIKSGWVNDVYFNIEADDIDGHGDLIVKYKDLEIEILDKEFGKNQNILRRIGSFLANKVVIKSQNPTKRGTLNEGAVYFKRRQHKFIFNYWWHLVLSGLKSTITGETEKEMRENSGK